MPSTDLENVKSYSGRFASGAELSRAPDESALAADYYEILRVGPQADEETIERVYRTLAARFHPDNTSTGDPETFSYLSKVWETLSDRARRANYDLLRQSGSTSRQLRLRGREFFDGVRGAQNRRLAVLCLLYRRRTRSHEWPGLTLLDLEQHTGCTLEELTSALWYLREKQWAVSGEGATYSITIGGFDVVEDSLTERLEFRALATCHCGLPGKPNDRLLEARSGRKEILPLDIEPALTRAGDAVADHYEVLGIAPQADEETIERVYRTLADRFHPDNPLSGNARTFLRVREAWETLSDRSKRAEYDALRSRTTDSERFRLRSREFFDGIEGEQLRRLAVLCLLYRQAAAELPGLTVLDLERLTGCTREELGSALWYLREKKWVRFGDYSEYSITAVGFDVVETKLDEQEAANQAEERSEMETRQTIQIEATAPEPEEWGAPSAWSWLNPDESDGNQFAQPAADSFEHTAPAGKNAEPLMALPAAAGDVSLVAAGETGREIAGSDAERDVVIRAAEHHVVNGENTEVAVQSAKRVIFSMGGKGGVGKTTVMAALAEWFEENRIPVILLDLDMENKACGSLTHFFDGRVPKINIHTPAGLDAFVDILGEDAPAILADQGAGAGQITHDWFHKMYPDVAEAGVVFTAIGVVTSDPASVESVLAWGAALQDRVDYVIVENHLTEYTDFSYWRQSEQAEEFRKRCQPAVIRVDYRLADLENPARSHGVTLGKIANRKAASPELRKASLVIRAQSYRRRMFAEFDKVRELLLP